MGKEGRGAVASDAVGWGAGQDPSSELLAETSPVSLSLYPESLSQGLAPGRPWRNVCGMNDWLMPLEPPLRTILLLPPEFILKCPRILQWLSTVREQNAKAWAWQSAGFSASSPISLSYFLHFT